MKKLISVLLAATILFSCFSGCSRKKKNKPVTQVLQTGTKRKDNSNVEGPKTGPVGTWSIPAPEINPLGSQTCMLRHLTVQQTSVVNYLETIHKIQKDCRESHGR